VSVEVREVEQATSEFAGVLALWRANRRYLGFLPEAGFGDRAQKGTLIAAIADEAPVGYVLYDLPGDRVKIVHLCVASAARRRGVAGALIEAVSARHRDRRGLELKCRRDFPASKLWPTLGFRPVLDLPGRSAERHLLTVWQLPHEHADLFTFVDERRELAVIDNNVFQDLITDRPQGRATRNLLNDWLFELVELCTTDELWHEINACEDATLRAEMRAHAEGFRKLSVPRTSWLDLSSIVAKLAPDAGPADHRHVARAVAANATYFVTRDDEILDAADELREQLRISVTRPEMLIVALDRVRSSGLYEPEALQATSIRAVAPSDLDQKSFVTAFLNYGAGERSKDLRDVLRPALASPDTHDVRTFRSADEQLLGSVVHSAQTGHVEVKLVRVSSSDRVGRAVARQLAFLPRQVAALRSLARVIITDPNPSRPVLRCLEDEGYRQDEHNRWVCDVRRGIADINVVESSRAPDATVAAALERCLWPLKITGAALPTFMIAVHPAWAEQLFDTNLAAATLFGRRLDLGLSREHVYYRGPGWAGGLAHPARILWYVKGGTPGHPVGHLRATSQLAEVVVGRPRTLHQRFARLGVWTEQQVCDAANANNTVMALRFTDTEVFERPLDLSTLNDIFATAGESFRAPQSPQRVDERMFCLLYRRASAHAS
jgi:GNAT superfamily N-acetyltransferase/predicted nucleic acid-binding protein